MAFIKRKLTKEDKLWLRSIKAPTFISGDYGACIVENEKKEIALVCLGGQGVMTEKGKYISDMPEVWLLILKIIKEALEVYGTDAPGVEYEDVHFWRFAEPVYVSVVR